LRWCLRQPTLDLKDVRVPFAAMSDWTPAAAFSGDRVRIACLNYNKASADIKHKTWHQLSQEMRYICCSVTAFQISPGWRSRRPGPNDGQFSPMSQVTLVKHDTGFLSIATILLGFMAQAFSTNFMERIMSDKTNSGAAFTSSSGALPHQVKLISVLWRKKSILWQRNCYYQSPPLDINPSNFHRSQILPTHLPNIYLDGFLPSHSKFQSLCFPRDFHT
jgi:hypothetical protein